MVYRSFQMQKNEKQEEEFSMFSKVSSEFEDIVLLTSAPLALTPTDDFPDSIVQIVAQGSRSSVPFDFRLNEMQYFCQVLSMFNPKIKQEYETQTSPSDLPQE